MIAYYDSLTLNVTGNLTVATFVMACNTTINRINYYLYTFSSIECFRFNVFSLYSSHELSMKFTMCKRTGRHPDKIETT